MPMSRVAPSRLAVVVGALSAPALVVLVLLALAGELRPGAAVAAICVIAAGLAFLVHQHFARLDALRSRVSALAREHGSLRPVDDHGGTLSVVELEAAIADLDSGWARRGEETRVLAAANEAVLEAIPDPLVLVDARHKVMRANAAARALFGDDIAERDLYGALRHPEVLEAADECLAGRTGIEAIELPWPGPPERRFAVRLARLPTRDVAQGESVILLVLHDVTALKQAENMRADFVANVSHELRTPLAALLGFIETLRGAARDDAAARTRFLGIMQDQAQRMSRLVSDLLSLSRIEESEHTRPTDAVEIGRVIGGVIDTVAFQAKSKGIRVDLDVPAGLPAVYGDADQLAQVFQNLVDNAIKYSKPQGQVRVSARAATTPPPRLPANPAGWITVNVADDGEGILAEHIPRLTERFYRVDTARSRQMGGTGLGLAIVKHILNRHRGTLTIVSSQGQGSTFSVWLPIKQT
jgi:two-component system, OmpR family, phosphate regulon sensor histidine kinase PhoR